MWNSFEPKMSTWGSLAAVAVLGGYLYVYGVPKSLNWRQQPKNDNDKK